MYQVTWYLVRIEYQRVKKVQLSPTCNSHIPLSISPIAYLLSFWFPHGGGVIELVGVIWLGAFHHRFNCSTYGGPRLLVD